MRSDYNNSQGGLLCNTTKDTSYNSEKSTQKETFEIANCQVRVCVCAEPNAFTVLSLHFKHQHKNKN